MSRRSSSPHPPRWAERAREKGAARGNAAPSLWTAFFALTVVAAGAAGCKVDEGAFYRTLFRCDPAAIANSCGTTSAGAAMVCFAASRLGSIDYCAEPCGADGPSERFVCQGPARLQVCDLAGEPSGCPESFECRDLGAGQGGCLPRCPDGQRCSVTGDGGSMLAASDAAVGGDPSDRSETDARVDDITFCTAGNAHCPTTSNGKPMICVPSSSLGGEDFCAEACDPAQLPDDPDNFACTDMRALLRRCHPDGKDGAADCPAGLHCFRTDLFANAGLCLWMPVCAEDRDCIPHDDHSTCSATLLGSTSPSASAIVRLDHLNCVHPNCADLQSQCDDLEGCLGTQYGSPLADMCVPSCDSELRCPPDFSCAITASGPGSPRLCLPGLPGERCDGEHCVVGSCEDTGAGFRACTLRCESDAFCAILNNSTHPFVCVEGGGYRHCVTPQAFNGSNCASESQCRAERNEKCAFYDLYGFTPDHGDCRVRCNSDGTCDPQGGMAFACLQNGEGGCFPGVLGVPCKRQLECISGLTCQDVAPEPEVPQGNLRICTLPCSVEGGTDADGDRFCSDQKTTARHGYCGGGVCRLVRAPGLPCDRHAQCQSGLCDIVNRVCAMPAGLPPR